MEAKNIPVMSAHYSKDGLAMTTEVHSDYSYRKDLNQKGVRLSSTAENVRHPMDMVNQLSRIEAPDNLHTIKFTFSLEPSSITVKCWSDRYIGIREAYEIMYEDLKVIGNLVHLPQGEPGYIFQVHAMWPQGYINYEFYLVPGIRLTPASK